MKKGLLVFLMLIAIFVHGKLIFANESKTEENIEKNVENIGSELVLIENLFRERTHIWNDLYESNRKLEFYKEKLSQVVAEPLLAFDLGVLESLLNDPTDLDRVLEVNVVQLEDLYYGKTNMISTATILWKMKGLEAQYVEEIRYKVILVKDKGVWKLSDYSVIQ